MKLKNSDWDVFSVIFYIITIVIIIITFIVPLGKISLQQGGEKI